MRLPTTEIRKRGEGLGKQNSPFSSYEADGAYAFEVKEIDTKNSENVHVFHSEVDKEEERWAIQRKIEQYLKFGDVPPEQRGALLVILLIVFFDLFAVGLVYPMIPFYAESLGATKADIGALSSMYGVLQLFGSLLVGTMSDKYGRKTMFYLSLASSCFSYLGIAFAPSLFFLFLVRIPIGLLKQTISLSTVIIADISPPDERTRFIGLIGTVVGMGFIFGPVTSGIISKYMGTYMPIYVCAGIYVGDMYLLYRYFPSSKAAIFKRAVEVNEDDHFPRDKKPPTLSIYSALSRPHDFFSLLFSSSIPFLLLIQFASTLAELLFSSTFQQFAFTRFDLSPSENGLLMSYMALLDVIVQGLIIGPLTKLRREDELMKMSVVIYSGAVVVVGMVSSFNMVLIALIPAAWGYKVFATCLTSEISRAAPKSELGSIFGISGSLASLCRAISPYLGALLVTHFGSLSCSFLVSLLALSLFFVLTLFPLRPQ